MLYKVQLQIYPQSNSPNGRVGPILLPFRGNALIGGEHFTYDMFDCYNLANPDEELQWIELGSEIIATIEFFHSDVDKLLHIGSEIEIGAGGSTRYGKGIVVNIL